MTKNICKYIYFRHESSNINFLYKILKTKINHLFKESQHEAYLSKILLYTSYHFVRKQALFLINKWGKLNNYTNLSLL